MRRRSLRELTFRARQEVNNFRLFRRPPALPARAGKAAAPFVDSSAALDACRGTPYAESLVTLAEQILDHRFPLLAWTIETGPEIAWRRDYLSGKETGPLYFRKIPYLDAARCGDHKVIWELNRHQHLVTLAQAWRLTGRAEFVAEIERQQDSWLSANPFQCGINWASALEVAFRALSWMWVDHLAGGKMTSDRRRLLLTALYRHGCHLETNLSFYFSPNTHVLGEAVALHALGRMFGETNRGRRWQTLGARVVSGEMDRQVQSDGSHFERSTYYHVYALDMFLFHATLAPVSEDYLGKLAKMAEYLETLLAPSRSLPLVGDDDGGRFFHPFGARPRFGVATLAACGSFLKRPEWIGDPADRLEIGAWWLGTRGALKAAGHVPGNTTSTCFSDAGMVAMRAGENQILIRTGGLGPFRGGHSHADALSVVARSGGRELLIDPGTLTYTGAERSSFRGTAAHNTVRVNGLDQADQAGPFAWENPPRISIGEWRSDEASDTLEARCLARGVLHRRRLWFRKPDLVFILDEIRQENQQLMAEQFWHAGVPVEKWGPNCFRLGSSATLLLAEDHGKAELSEGWRSLCYGHKEVSPVIVCSQTGQGTIYFGALLAFSAIEGELVLKVNGDSVELTLRGEPTISARFATDSR